MSTGLGQSSLLRREVVIGACAGLVVLVAAVTLFVLNRAAATTRPASVAIGVASPGPSSGSATQSAAGVSPSPTRAPVQAQTPATVASPTVARAVTSTAPTPARSTAGARPTTPAATGSTPKATKRAAVPAASKATPVTVGQVHTGTATYYGAAKPGGACMTQTVPATKYTAAISHEDWAGSSLCQSYLQVTGAKGTILVKVDNVCPDAICVSGHLDLSTEAFAALDDLGKGVVPITWRLVKNPPVQGDVILTVKDGSHQYWLGMHVDNTGNAITSMEIADGNGPFKKATQGNNGFFTQPNSPGKGPFRVRITDAYGHTITATGITLQPGLLQHTGLRLY